MAFGAAEGRDVDSFLNEVRPWSRAYPHVGFSGVALRDGDVWRLYAGRIVVGGVVMPERTFKSANVLAFRVEESLDFNEAKPLLEQYLDEGFSIGDVTVKFRPSLTGSGRFSTQHRSFRETWTNAQARSTALSFFGEPLERYRAKGALDLEVMAAREPYSSFAELVGDFGVLDMNGAGGYLEVVAHAPCGFDTALTTLSTDTATVTVMASPHLDETLFSLGVLIQHDGTTRRLTFESDQSTWTVVNNIRVGVFRFTVPPASILKLFLRYDGHIQTYYWLVDPGTAPNTRRVIHQTFDVDLARVSEMVGRSPDNKRNAREFELGLSWLFWMHGFSPLYWGAAQDASDAPDLVVASANGSMLVIEATTGVLQSGGKLTKLLARTQRLKSALDKAKSNVVVLPVLCTSSSEEEIAADLDHAHSFGVGVMSAAALQRLLTSTYFIPDSDKIVRDLREALEAYRARKQPDALPRP